METQSLTRFRTNLRTAMERRQISQREMGTLAHMSYPYINRVLTGKIDPGLNQVDAMAEAIGIPLPTLLLPPAVFELTADPPAVPASS